MSTKHLGSVSGREKYQTLQVELSDGRKGTFTGRALFEDPIPEGLYIKEILWFTPKELPVDCFFEPMDKQ
jgi:hypothetical protein